MSARTLAPGPRCCTQGPCGAESGILAQGQDVKFPALLLTDLPGDPRPLTAPSGLSFSTGAEQDGGGH